MSNREYAEELANRPYSEMAMRDRSTDNDYLYIALTPELEGCVVQGETMREALDNLQLFRIDYIEHLLDNNLLIPDPVGISTRTEGNTIVLLPEDALSSFEKVSGKVIQSGQREQLIDFQLKVETGAIEHR